MMSEEYFSRITLGKTRRYANELARARLPWWRRWFGTTDSGIHEY
jgi:hypothetical protein